MFYVADTFKERVDQYLQTKYHGFVKDIKYYTGTTGQRYALVITKGVWYKIRLFVENELPYGIMTAVDIGLETNNSTTVKMQPAVFEVLKTKEELTMKRAEQYMDTIKDLFEQPTISKIYNTLKICPICFPVKAAESSLLYPERYFSRGEILLRQEDDIFIRGGVYVGDKKIISFADGKVHEGDLLYNFAGGEATCQIYTLNFIVNIRSKECIANEAVKAFDDTKRNERYNSAYSSWQSFISICSTGVSYALSSQ